MNMIQWFKCSECYCSYTPEKENQMCCSCEEKWDNSLIESKMEMNIFTSEYLERCI